MAGCASRRPHLNRLGGSATLCPPCCELRHLRRWGRGALGEVLDEVVRRLARQRRGRCRGGPPA
eukprot:5346158-Lingulodinium_polyedra.AAC.1